MNRDPAITGDFGNTFLQMVERNVHAPVNVLAQPLVWTSDIQHQRRLGVR
jgi:hypothetical protein